MLGANGDFASLNLYAYCGNNPVTRKDNGGYAWETVFDILSLGVSIAEVAVNPVDPWAWIGLVGDIVDVAVPFVGGIGEATRALKAVSTVVDNADNVIDAAKTAYKSADAASDIRRATGSYEILYKSGYNYVGKGGFQRAITSATQHAKDYGDEVAAIMWKPAANKVDAFIDEYALMRKRGVGLENMTYNKIWSPGRKYYGQMIEKLLD